MLKFIRKMLLKVVVIITILFVVIVTSIKLANYLIEKHLNELDDEVGMNGVFLTSFTYDTHSKFFIDASLNGLIGSSLINKIPFYNICEYIYNVNKDIEYAKKFGIYPYPEKKYTKYLKNLTICGDSYAGYMNDYLSKYFDTSRNSFIRAGKTLKENLKFYKGAMRSGYKYVFLSIGVNDHINQVEPENFRKELDELCYVAYMNKKKVFIHSFVNYGDDVDHEYKYTSKFKYRTYIYDMIIQSVAARYDNVIYVDCRDIADLSLLTEDRLHFNMCFYNKLAKKMLDALISN